MKELSLHVLDIAQNSITANAKLILITIVEDLKADILSIEITDDGKGMSEEMLEKVRDPFITTRTTRSVGMGISLFAAAAELCGGCLDIKSELGVGTSVTARFKHSNIDRQPIGDMAQTFTALVSANPDIDFVYKHIIEGESFNIDTRELKEILKDVPISSIEVVIWIKEYIEDALKNISGGKKT